MKYLYIFLIAPGASPLNIRAFAEDSGSIRIIWGPPPIDQQHGLITGYKINYVENSRPDSDSIEIAIQNPIDKSVETDIYIFFFSS